MLFDEQQQQEQQATDDSVNYSAQSSTLALHKVDFVGGPIPWVSLLSSFGNHQNQHQYCLYAHGPFLRVEALSKTKKENSETKKKEEDDVNQQHSAASSSFSTKLLTLEGQNVHGVDFVTLSSRQQQQQSNHDDTTTTTLAVAFGGRQAALVLIHNGSQQQEEAEPDNATVSPLLQRIPIQAQQQPIINNNQGQQPQPLPTTTSILEFSDWLWDCQLARLPLKNSSSNDDDDDGGSRHDQEFLLYVGTAHNNVQVWSLSLIRRQQSSSVDSYYCNCQQLCQFSGSRRSILYSLCFWKTEPRTTVTSTNDTTNTTRLPEQSKKEEEEEPFAFQVAVGTVTNEILIWGVKDIRNHCSVSGGNGATPPTIASSSSNTPNQTTTRATAFITESHVLQGHQGVIHAVQFNDTATLLASASDDRTIRLWGKHCHGETTNDQQENDHPGGEGESSCYWTLHWVGWGHTARCWNVTFCNNDWLASCGEDGTVRLWSILNRQDLEDDDNNKGSQTKGRQNQQQQQLAILHGNSSYWSMDYCAHSGMLAAGGNDGTVHLFHLPSRLPRLQQEDQGRSTHTTNSGSDNDREHPARSRTVVTVPDDRKIVPGKNEQPNTKDNNQPDNTNKPKKTKKKKATVPKQTFVGVEFVSYDKGHFVRVATRDGSVMELNLDNAQIGKWHVRTPWWSNNDTVLTRFDIESSQGCCMASHPKNAKELFAVGTMRGHVLLCRGEGERIVLDGSRYKTVQNIKWHSDRILLVYHVQSVRIWEFDGDIDQQQDLESAARVTTYSAGEKAVVISAALNRSRTELCVGNNRGVLSLFPVPNGKDTRQSRDDAAVQASSWRRLHKKEHINDIQWIAEDRIISVGNDGCLCECKVVNETELIEMKSVPIRAFTGIDRILLPPLVDESIEDSFLLGGYCGNEYMIIDHKTCYEFFRTDTGGRSRKLLLSLDGNGGFEGKPLISSISAPRKDGLNELIIESQWMDHPEKIPFSLGSNLHNETLFDVDLSRHSNGNLVMMSASEDCSSRITVWNERMEIQNQALLPPQESGVRAICAKSLPSSSKDGSNIFVVEGGCKLLLRFYLVKVGDMHTIQSEFIGEGSQTDNATIDHRINAVDSAPMDGDESVQFVISGDSNGHVFAYIVPVKGFERKRLPGKLVFENPRPVLSLKALNCGAQNCHIVVGTSGGDLFVLAVPLLNNELNSEESKIVHYFHAHSMGTNCISTFFVDSETSKRRFRVCSGGDDQAITCFDVNVEESATNTACTIRDVVASQQVSISAIRGISWLDNRRIACSGYGQKLSVWELTDDCKLERCQVIDTEIGDVNSLAASTQNGDSVIAIAGIGSELYSFR